MEFSDFDSDDDYDESESFEPNAIKRIKGRSKRDFVAKAHNGRAAHQFLLQYYEDKNRYLNSNMLGDQIHVIGICYLWTRSFHSD